VFFSKLLFFDFLRGANKLNIILYQNLYNLIKDLRKTHKTN